MILDWAADIWPVIDREWDGIEVHSGTLSELLARVARVDTPVGKAAFSVALTAGSAWLWWHIVTFECSRKAGR